MATWPRAVYPAMVHDDHGTIEGGADSIGSSDVGGHVFIAALRSANAAIESIEHDGDWYAYLFVNCANQSCVVANQVQGDRLKEEWDLVYIILEETLPEGCNPRLNPGLAFKRAIDNRTCIYAAASVVPPEGNVHHRIEDPE